MAADLTLTKNDKDFDIFFTVKDENGALFDLTPYTVKFNLSDTEFDNKISGACIITDAVNGACKYNVNAGDLDLDLGVYLGELELTAGAKVITSQQDDTSHRKFSVQIIGECG